MLPRKIFTSKDEAMALEGRRVRLRDGSTVNLHNKIEEDPPTVPYASDGLKFPIYACLDDELCPAPNEVAEVLEDEDTEEKK